MSYTYFKSVKEREYYSLLNTCINAWQNTVCLNVPELHIKDNKEISFSNVIKDIDIVVKLLTISFKEITLKAERCTGVARQNRMIKLMQKVYQNACECTYRIVNYLLHKHHSIKKHHYLELWRSFMYYWRLCLVSYFPPVHYSMYYLHKYWLLL